MIRTRSATTAQNAKRFFAPTSDHALIVAAPPGQFDRSTTPDSSAISPDTDSDADTDWRARLVIIRRRRTTHDDHVIIAVRDPRRARTGVLGRIRLARLPGRRRIHLLDRQRGCRAGAGRTERGGGWLARRRGSALRCAAARRPDRIGPTRG